MFEHMNENGALIDGAIKRVVIAGDGERQIDDSNAPLAATTREKRCNLQIDAILLVESVVVFDFHLDRFVAVEGAHSHVGYILHIKCAVESDGPNARRRSNACLNVEADRPAYIAIQIHQKSAPVFFSLKVDQMQQTQKAN